MPTSLFAPRPVAPTSRPTPTKKNYQRPKGLWKARVTDSSASRLSQGTPVSSQLQHARPSDSSDNNNPDFEELEIYSDSSSCKKRRLSCSEEGSELGELYFWDYSRQCSPQPKRESSWTRRTRIMDTSSLAAKGSQMNSKPTCDYEDWEDLKDLFSKAVEQYEGVDASSALPLIRGVIHECHRFMLFYQDPSVLFSNPTNIPGHSPHTPTPPEERLQRDWAEPTDGKAFANCKCVEPPTAFHAIFGTALFLFGNLIAQDPSLAVEGEPDSPLQYWLAAIDVFETGENLPTMTSGKNPNLPEDWRMAIVWGRVLVCLADDTISRLRKQQSGSSDESSSSSTVPIQKPIVGPFFADEPNWPRESPFSVIVQRRPPLTRRMSFLTASPDEILKLAMDQFSRGIFHMPHPSHAAQPAGGKKAASSSLLLSAGSGGGGGGASDFFSRPKELFTIASEVLLVADKLDKPLERKYWASWADSVFNQMKMEADLDAWRGPINRARGQCCLIAGTAQVEEFEDALERGDESVLKGEDADEAREALGDAIAFLEKARSAAKAEREANVVLHEHGDVDMGGEVEHEDRELRHFLEEALVTLANLTLNRNKREELYARAQKESGGVLDFDQMDES